MFPTAPDGDELYYGAMQIYFDRLKNGVHDGAFFMGDISAASFTTADTKIERFSHSTAAREQMKSTLKQRKATFKGTLAQYNPDNVALATMSDLIYHTQAAGTQTDIPVKSCKGGRWIRLPHHTLDEVTDVSKGATVFVEGDDYEVDLVQGMLYVIPGGDINALVHPDDLTVTYDTLAITGTAMPLLEGGKATVIEGRIRLVGVPTEGPTWDGDIYLASVTPEGDLGLITEDYGEFSINFEILKAPGQTRLYEMRRRVA